MWRNLGKAVTGISRDGADRDETGKGRKEGGGKWGEGFSSPPKQWLLAI